MLNTLFLLALASSLGLSSNLNLGNQVRSDIKKALAPNTTLYVYNCEDYILDEEGDSLIDDFEQYVLDTDGVKLNVVYSTYDTNETMLNSVQTGASRYDLIAPSDYMIQKMIGLDLLEPFANTEQERKDLYGDRYEGWEDNYDTYASPYLKDWFDKIMTMEPSSGYSVPLSKYAKGYMWGTLGLTYNPSYSTYAERGLSEDDVKVQLTDWNALWHDNFQDSFQIKDSVRDTYAIGLTETYDELIRKLRDDYISGLISEEFYSSEYSIIFNNINHIDEFNAINKRYFPDAETQSIQNVVDKVQVTLENLKRNCYGLEVDSGKTDVASGSKSGITMAWSGDAITSLDLAEEEYDLDLYYSVPETGGNIWFDGWVMLKYDGLNKEYAQKFIDFLSDSENAGRNMDYIGYTPFIAGEGIRDLVRNWYDPRMSMVYAYDLTADDYYYDEEDNYVFKDGSDIKEVLIDGETHEIDFGTESYVGSTFYDNNANPTGHAVVDGVTTSWESFAEDNDWTLRDLTYFFEGSLDDADDKSSYFYSDEIETVTGKDLNGETKTVQVGRQFLAQYPSKVEADRASYLNQIPSLAVMEDYGENNTYVLKMWENVKSGGTLTTPIIVIFSVEIAAFVILGGVLGGRKLYSKKLRKKRRAEAKGN